MIYVASVYSKNAQGNDETSRKLREKRAQYVMKRVGEMIIHGLRAYSPIAHCHQMSNLLAMPKDYDFWQDQDRHFIDVSEAVYVLKMPHWEESKGITDEIQYAKQTGKDVIYLECPDYEE